MSEPLRIALAVEGDTDLIVIKAAIASLLLGREVEFTTLQPEHSLAFGILGGDTGMGWSGVYRWCRQTASEGGGRVSGSALFKFHDILIVHIDGDVAGMTYESANIEETILDLPCKQPCPPASATAAELRKVVLRWMGENATPVRCVLCTPCMNMEAWVIIALFPTNSIFQRKGPEGWECHENPEGQLGQLPVSVRIRKTKSHYEGRKTEIAAAWPSVCAASSEARRFSTDFHTVHGVAHATKTSATGGAPTSAPSP